MNNKNIKKLEFAKRVLSERNIIFKELANGQLQVDSANFWSTTEKWFYPKTKTKGQGINSFITFLKDNNIIG
jgi:hypothetical protein